MDNIINTLQKLGLEEKEITIYLALLTLGQSPIRKIGEFTGINRGTTHEILRNLQSLGLVSYYHKEKHQHFIAEDPKILNKILSKKESEIESAKADLKKILPNLYSLSKQNERPVVKFYENYSGIRAILEDVLYSVEKLSKKDYVVYSSSLIRPYLYHRDAHPKFSDERIEKNIGVRTIANGAGGQTVGQDERKWLTKKESAPTYKLIYAGKVAIISVGKNNIPHGLIIEDEGIFKTELFMFDSLWKTIK